MFERCPLFRGVPSLHAEFSCVLCSPLSAAPCPIASSDDYVYWSSEPKLVDVWKDMNTLGLSIMTREVSALSLGLGLSLSLSLSSLSFKNYASVFFFDMVEGMS